MLHEHGSQAIGPWRPIRQHVSGLGLAGPERMPFMTR